MEKRKWTKEEKRFVLKEAEREGLQVTLRKYWSGTSGFPYFTHQIPGGAKMADQIRIIRSICG